jgi:hypothetical protein
MVTCTIAFGARTAQYIHGGSYVRKEAIHFLAARMQERERERERRGEVKVTLTLQGHPPNDLTSFH